MHILNRFNVALLAVLLTALAGCVQLAPSPSVAHSGDTIVLGLGGINRNWGGDKPRNLQLSITDAANQTFPLEAAVTFQAYPDYRAAVNVTALNGSDGLNLQAFDGAWFIAVTLTDNIGPLNLAPGPATIALTADNFEVARDAQGQPFTLEGDLTQIPLQILAGPPSPNNTSTQYGAYDNRGTHFLVRPSGSAGTTTIGGAYYAIQYLSDSNFNEMKPMAFPVSHNPFVKMDYKVHDNGNGTGTYFVYVYNPAGFTATGPRQPKQAALADLGVHLEYFELGAEAWMKTNFVIDQANSYFIDINGNKINGLQPEIRYDSDL
jgi:hypothetical protein